MNRISNKHKRNATGEWCKHPRRFLKKLGNSRLRAAPLEELSLAGRKTNRPLKRYRSTNLCPFCLSHIPKQWERNTFKHYGSCKNCGAIKQGKIKCSKCHSIKVWLQCKSYMCKSCGKRW
jgi:hypothetical protein